MIPDTAHVEPVASVEDGRTRLDAIDQAIRDLITTRRSVSQQVQRMRQEAGGARIEHSRENQILAGYADALGRPGVAVAMAVLEFCRGPATS